MFFKNYQNMGKTTELVTTFGGFCHRDVIGDGQWYEMQNMSGAKHPAICTRPKRKILTMVNGEYVGNVAAICDMDGLVWLGRDGSLHAGGHALENFYTYTEADRQLIPMGGYLIVWPDKVWANAVKLRLGQEMVKDEDYGALEAYWEQENDQPASAIQEDHAVRLVPCQKDGSYFAAPPKGYVAVDKRPDINLDDIPTVDGEEEPPPVKVMVTSTYPYQLYYLQAADKWYPEGIYYGYIISDERPEKPDNGCLWMDTSKTPPVLQKWNESTRMWTVQEVYLRMEYEGGFGLLQKGDTVDLIMPAQLFENDKIDPWGVLQTYYAPYENPLGDSLGDKSKLQNVEIIEKGSDYIVFKGALGEPVTIGSYHRQLVNCALYAKHNQASDEIEKNGTEEDLWAMTDEDLIEFCASLTTHGYGATTGMQRPISIERTVPEMDFVIECGNRLWGCYYGQAEDGTILNEIYASKLGDFKNWRTYQGLSTDSYAASRGSDGPWTGAIAMNNYPLFFKRNCLEKIYISASGAHQIATTKMPGVQPGSWRSMQIVDGALFYLSDNGVMAYDGSLPDRISEDLGDIKYKNGVGGKLADSYYLSVTAQDGSCDLFHLDTGKGMWHREDGLRLVQTADRGDALYWLTEDGQLMTPGTLAEQDEGLEEEDFVWEIVSGAIGYQRAEQEYLLRLIPRIKLEPGGSVRVHVMYDDNGTWQRVGCIEGNSTHSVTIPVKTRRCDHFRIKLSGIGGATLYSITREIEKGSMEA